MPLETPARPRTALTTELALPPPFSAVRLREVGDAFAHAISIAGEQGAGTLVYVGRFDLAEFALVLEPDEPLLSARRAFYAGMAALAEALAAHAQPDTSVTIDWPGSLLVNQGLVGGGRLAWPRDLEEDQTPEWLVFGGMVRTVSMSGLEPGLNPLVTALEEEGFTDVMSSQLLESFARNFMRIVDSWQENGFGAVAKNYIGRMPGEQGVRRDIDENGDLMIRRVGKVEVDAAKVPAAARTTGVVRSRHKGTARVKLIRTIRLDASDTFVFEKAAEPGEWAVSGAFVFWDRDPGSLEGKERSAFRGGFLGIDSLGWSTLVQIVEATAHDRHAAVDALAKQLVAKFGAPTIDAAAAAGRGGNCFRGIVCAHSRRTRSLRSIANLKMARCAKRFAPCVHATARSRRGPSPFSRWKVKPSSRASRLI